MQVDQDIDNDKQTVVMTVSGTLSDEGLLSLADRLEKTPHAARTFSLLIDLRFADGSKVTTDGVRKMASRRLVLPPGTRRAVVVPSALGFGMARMYELLRGEGAFRVFMDYDRARRWAETGAG